MFYTANRHADGRIIFTFDDYAMAKLFSILLLFFFFLGSFEYPPFIGLVFTVENRIRFDRRALKADHGNNVLAP